MRGWDVEGAAHEPQDSLQATPRRLPIEGEPCECEQEVEESVVTVGRTNRTVETVEASEMIADVDGLVSLGEEPAERVCGIESSRVCDGGQHGGL